jgi:hypothetical protein
VETWIAIPHKKKASQGDRNNTLKIAETSPLSEGEETEFGGKFDAIESMRR